MGSQNFDPYFSHWADIAARRVVAEHPREEGDARPIVVAAGITPSGVVHVGELPRSHDGRSGGSSFARSRRQCPLHLLLGRFRRLPKGALGCATTGDADG